MQLNIMDSSGRSNINDRDSELGDDMSPDDHSGDEMCDCDSVEGIASRLSTSVTNNGTGTTGNMNGPEHPSAIGMGHHHQFPSNHPLNALGSFMGIGCLHGIPNLQHNDVLEKLKMQVRDIKVGLMDQEYAAAHGGTFGSNVLPTTINTAFTLPPTTMATYTHAAQTLVAHAGNNLNSHLNTNSPLPSSLLPNGSRSSFSFTSPTAPSSKDVNPASNSSTSSETSNSSQQNNGWSFEEQYKQVRQLYEINDDPKRKEFLDDLFSFMQKRGKPINRLPIMAKSVLDLYELYNLVIARGGLVDVINKKLWQEIIKGLHLPSSITSAAFTLRTQYMKYLYPYECEKKNLSTPGELEAAIDGNRREGRRSSYGQYEAMHNQMQLPQIARQSLPSGMQQMSPLALVTHVANNQQAQAAAAAAAAHHRLMTPSFGQVPNLLPQEIEQRMIEYLKLIHVKKDQNASGTMGLSPHQQQQQPRQRSQSPEISRRDALNALELSRVALWQMCHNNSSPTTSVKTSPQGGGNVNSSEIQNMTTEAQRDALNLCDSPPNLNTVKREHEHEPSPEVIETSDFHLQPPPAKRAGFPASFYLPPGVYGMATAVANYNYKENHHDSNETEVVEENNNEDHNTAANVSRDDSIECQQLNNASLSVPRHCGIVHNEKSEDSAIENSSTTSTGSAANVHVSPLFTKKAHISKQTQPQCTTSNVNAITMTSSDNLPTGTSTSQNPLEELSLLSGMQFRVTRNGTNSNGEQELVVNLDLNGIKYTGVLIAHTPSLATATTSSTKPTKSAVPQSILGNSYNSKNFNESQIEENNITNSNHISVHMNSNSSKTIKDLAVARDQFEDTSEPTMRDTETQPNISTKTTTNQTNAIIANCSKNSSHTLEDSLTTS